MSNNVYYVNNSVMLNGHVVRDHGQGRAAQCADCQINTGTGMAPCAMLQVLGMARCLGIDNQSAMAQGTGGIGPDRAGEKCHPYPNNYYHQNG